MIDNWLASADYDAWRIGRDEDDGSDQDNSLDYDAMDPGLPTTCPECGGPVQDDPPDHDTGVRTGVVYCEGPDCDWRGMTY